MPVRWPYRTLTVIEGLTVVSAGLQGRAKPIRHVSRGIDRSLNLNIACQHTDFATFVHAERDFTVMHVFERLIQR